MAEATVYIASRSLGNPPEVFHFASEKLPGGQADRCATGSGTPLVSYGDTKSVAVRIVNPDNGKALYLDYRSGTGQDAGSAYQQHGALSASKGTVRYAAFLRPGRLTW